MGLQQLHCILRLETTRGTSGGERYQINSLLVTRSGRGIDAGLHTRATGTTALQNAALLGHVEYMLRGVDERLES